MNKNTNILTICYVKSYRKKFFNQIIKLSKQQELQKRYINEIYKGPYGKIKLNVDTSTEF